jgi:hypothetical protein
VAIRLHLGDKLAGGLVIRWGLYLEALREDARRPTDELVPRFREEVRRRGEMEESIAVLVSVGGTQAGAEFAYKKLDIAKDCRAVVEAIDKATKAVA